MLNIITEVILESSKLGIIPLHSKLADLFSPRQSITWKFIRRHYLDSGNLGEMDSY